MSQTVQKFLVRYISALFQRALISQTHINMNGILAKKYTKQPERYLSVIQESKLKMRPYKKKTNGQQQTSKANHIIKKTKDRATRCQPQTGGYLI